LSSVLHAAVFVPNGAQSEAGVARPCPDSESGLLLCPQRDESPATLMRIDQGKSADTQAFLNLWNKFGERELHSFMLTISPGKK
jgi:hypothetical protein